MIEFSEYFYLKEEKLDKLTLSEILKKNKKDINKKLKNKSPENIEKLRLAIEEYKRAIEVIQKYYEKD